MWPTNISDLAIPLDVDADECSSRPCQNGGTCSTPAFDMYKCACLTGYTGTNCETGNYGLNAYLFQMLLFCSIVLTWCDCDDN